MVPLSLLIEFHTEPPRSSAVAIPLDDDNRHRRFCARPVDRRFDWPDGTAGTEIFLDGRRQLVKSVRVYHVYHSALCRDDRRRSGAPCSGSWRTRNAGGFDGAIRIDERDRLAEIPSLAR